MTDRVTSRWRVLTWNLRGSHQPDLRKIANVIATDTPDVVSLQEVRRRQARRLASLLGWQRVWARKHYPYTPLMWWRAEGLAVLSPGPMTHVLRTTISPGVTTWLFKHRILLAVTVTRPHGALRLYDTHLSSSNTDERIAQARRVAELVIQEAAPVAVVAGDMNTHPYDLVEIVREFLAVGLCDPGGDSSNPAIAPRQRLDLVMVPERARVTEQRVPEGGAEWAALSDHLPVLVEFEV